MSSLTAPRPVLRNNHYSNYSKSENLQIDQREALRSSAVSQYEIAKSNDALARSTQGIERASQDTAKATQSIAKSEKIKAVAAAYQAHQSKRMVESVDRLSIQLGDQLSLLNRTQQSTLSELEKQTFIMKHQEEKSEIQDAARNVLFEINVELDRVEGYGSNLEKYIASETMRKILQSKKINADLLSAIADKEYLYELVKRLMNKSKTALENITDEELKDLENLRSYKQGLLTVGNGKGPLEDQIDEMDSLITRLKNKKRFFKPVKALGKAATWMSLGIAFTSVTLFVFFHNKQPESDTLDIVFALMTLLSGLYFSVSLSALAVTGLLNMFEMKDTRPEHIKEINDAVEARTKLREKIDITDNYIFKTTRSLKEKIDKLANKYPALNVNDV